MNEIPTNPQRLPTVVRLARAAYALCAGLFAVCIVLQVFFAGAGVLVNPSYWELHRAFGHSIQLLTFVLLAFGLIGLLPWRMQALNVLIVLLFVGQYIFLWLMPSLGLPALRALHAVNALVLFWITVHLGQRAWRLIRAPQRAPGPDRPATMTMR